MGDHHAFAAQTLVEETEALMHPPNPTLRNPPSSVFSSKPTSKNLKNYDFRSYNGYPSEKWKIWVDSLKPKYQDIWKQAGIYDAILASTYKIPIDKELISGLAERWCAKKNTFIFAWGEVTITLEDVMFLGGFSVLGTLYLTSKKAYKEDGCVGIYDSLIKAYTEVKLVAGGTSSAPRWMEYFMCSGKELEHEAFLAMWMSRFVLIRCNGNIVIRDFYVAIHLSRGNRIALAPVVLASIYRNMRLLSNSDSKGCLRFCLCHPDIVHMWVWERFPKLRPIPSVMERAEPRSARWNRVKILKVRDVRAALDSGKESFIWCPYVQNEKQLPLISWGHKRRRSTKTESFGKRHELDDVTETVILDVQSMSLSDKCKQSISSTERLERPISLKEDVVVTVSDLNHVEVNNAYVDLAKDEFVSKANCPELQIVNIEEKRCDDTKSELPHLGLVDRIFRLEKIVDAIKSAKRDASSGRYFEA